MRKKEIKDYPPAFLPFFYLSGRPPDLTFDVDVVLYFAFVVGSTFAVSGLAPFRWHVCVRFSTFACSRGIGSIKGTCGTVRHGGSDELTVGRGLSVREQRHEVWAEGYNVVHI